MKPPTAKLSVGRMVRVYGPAAQKGGNPEASGVVTDILSDDMINVTVFPDMALPNPATSVRFVGDRPDGPATSFTDNVAFWPPKKD